MTDQLLAADAQPKARLIAVPDPAGASDSVGSGAPRVPYRIGLAADVQGAAFQIGDTGPGGQSLPWIYATATTGIRYEFNLRDGILTVVITDESTGEERVVRYHIDSAAMTGEHVIVGEPITVIFAYDNELSYDETPEISSWQATSGPRYFEELQQHISETSHVVAEFSAAVERAIASERIHEASRPPRSARNVRDATIDLTTEEIVGERTEEPIEYSCELPEGVQVIDPKTGKKYVGRRWVKPHEITTVNALVAGGYRMAVLRLANGDIASLYPNFSGHQLGVQIRTRSGMVGRVLDETAADTPIGNGERLTGTIERALDGDPSPAGQEFVSPPIVVVVGIGPEVPYELDVDLPIDHTLAEFRAALTERPLPRNPIERRNTSTRDAARRQPQRPQQRESARDMQRRRLGRDL